MVHDRKKISTKHEISLPSNKCDGLLSEFIASLQDILNTAHSQGTKDVYVSNDILYGYYDDVDPEINISWTEKRDETGEEMNARIKRAEKRKVRRNK